MRTIHTISGFIIAAALAAGCSSAPSQPTDVETNLRQSPQSQQPAFDVAASADTTRQLGVVRWAASFGSGPVVVLKGLDAGGKAITVMQVAPHHGGSVALTVSGLGADGKAALGTRTLSADGKLVSDSMSSLDQSLAVAAVGDLRLAGGKDPTPHAQVGYSCPSDWIDYLSATIAAIGCFGPWDWAVAGSCALLLASLDQCIDSPPSTVSCQPADPYGCCQTCCEYNWGCSTTCDPQNDPYYCY